MWEWWEAAGLGAGVEYLVVNVECLAEERAYTIPWGDRKGGGSGNLVKTPSVLVNVYGKASSLEICAIGDCNRLAGDGDVGLARVQRYWQLAATLPYV